MRAARRHSDRDEFKEQTVCTVTDLISWVANAITTTDAFGDYLLRAFLLKKLDPKVSFTTPVYDENGVPKMKPDKLLEVQTMTVADFLARLGLDAGKDY